MKHLLALAAIAGAALSASCGVFSGSAATAKHARAGSCHYDVTLLQAEPAVLEVDARCSGKELTGFSTAEVAAAPHISGVRTSGGQELASQGYRWQLPASSSAASIRYRIDLDAIARDVDHFDVSQRVGRSIVAPVSTWLLRPEPADLGVPVSIRVRTPPDVGFITGLRKTGETYSLEAHEIRTATYAVFGRFEQRSIRLPPLPSHPTATLELAVLDAPLDLPRAALLEWIEDSARAVARFWGGFPVERALLVLVPVRGRDGVLFGKVLPESAPGIALLFGQHTHPSKLYDDWVLVHELFHLGFPSFSREGKWLDEGLATYYEPLIRARHGWKSESAVWTEFVRAMPQAVRSGRVGGLEKSSTFREIYWGGAIVAMLADIEARKRSGGERGLEHGLRAVLAAGGDASQVWSLERVVSLIDARFEAPLLGPLSRVYSHQPAPVDLASLWRDLGVDVTPDGIALRDDAPLASIRKSVVYGPSGVPSGKP
jgi:hypothetical protein